MRQRTTQYFCLFAVVFAVTSGVARPDGRRVQFDREIRPILSDNCYACHGPDKQARQSELRLDTRNGAMAEIDGRFALVSGKPQESELVRRILSNDEDEMMPPATYRKRLTNEQKQLLVEWVRQGAAWSDQWTWSAPQRFKPPSLNSSTDNTNWIDQFIRARLEQEEIEASPEADRRILIRRICFDVLGLPPTSDQVAKFLNDNSENAWQSLVDELLRSPRFGERMAIYWLDLVRYADSVGYHGDQDTSVSPYRDYVINAFNSNMPFDQFTREQLGGDLLPEPTNNQLVASGYNKLGMMSAEGGAQAKEYLAKYTADRVRTTGSVWLGSTIACAECHDHKFDPFTTKDFYRFATFFADIQERGVYNGGQWGPTVEVQSSALPELLQPITSHIAELQTALVTQTPELTAAQLEWETATLSQQTDWQPVITVSAEAQNGSQLAIQQDGSVLVSGPDGQFNMYTVGLMTSLDEVTGLTNRSAIRDLDVPMTAILPSPN